MAPKGRKQQEDANDQLTRVAIVNADRCVQHRSVVISS